MRAARWSGDGAGLGNGARFRVIVPVMLVRVEAPEDPTDCVPWFAALEAGGRGVLNAGWLEGR